MTFWCLAARGSVVVIWCGGENAARVDKWADVSKSKENVLIDKGIFGGTVL